MDAETTSIERYSAQAARRPSCPPFGVKGSMALRNPLPGDTACIYSVPSTRFANRFVVWSVATAGCRFPRHSGIQAVVFLDCAIDRWTTVTSIIHGFAHPETRSPSSTGAGDKDGT